MKKKSTKVTKTTTNKPKFMAVLTRRYDNKIVFTGVLTLAACLAFLSVYEVRNYTDTKVTEIEAQNQSFLVPKKTAVLGAVEANTSPDKSACDNLRKALCGGSASMLCADVQTVCSELGY